MTFSKEQLRFIIRILESRQRGYMAPSTTKNKRKINGRVKNVKLCNFWLSILRPLLEAEKNKFNKNND